MERLLLKTSKHFILRCSHSVSVERPEVGEGDVVGAASVHSCGVVVADSLVALLLELVVCHGLGIVEQHLAQVEEVGAQDPSWDHQEKMDRQFRQNIDSEIEASSNIVTVKKKISSFFCF